MRIFLSFFFFLESKTGCNVEIEVSIINFLSTNFGMLRLKCTSVRLN